MTQDSRTTESANRDNAAIRDIMHQIQDRLTVPDRATLTLGLVGHLATLMNGRQIEKLMGELQEQAERVQDVPPARRVANAERDLEREEQSRQPEPRRGNAPAGRQGEHEVGLHGRGAVTGNTGPIL